MKTQFYNFLLQFRSSLLDDGQRSKSKKDKEKDSKRKIKDVFEMATLAMLGIVLGGGRGDKGDGGGKTGGGGVAGANECMKLYGNVLKLCRVADKKGANENELRSSYKELKLKYEAVVGRLISQEVAITEEMEYSLKGSERGLKDIAALLKLPSPKARSEVSTLDLKPKASLQADVGRPRTTAPRLQRPLDKVKHDLQAIQKPAVEKPAPVQPKEKLRLRDRISGRINQWRNRRLSSRELSKRFRDKWAAERRAKKARKRAEKAIAEAKALARKRDEAEAEAAEFDAKAFEKFQETGGARLKPKAKPKPKPKVEVETKPLAKPKVEPRVRREPPAKAEAPKPAARPRAKAEVAARRKVEAKPQASEVVQKMKWHQRLILGSLLRSSSQLRENVKAVQREIEGAFSELARLRSQEEPSAGVIELMAQIERLENRRSVLIDSMRRLEGQVQDFGKELGTEDKPGEES